MILHIGVIAAFSLVASPSHHDCRAVEHYDTNPEIGNDSYKVLEDGKWISVPPEAVLLIENLPNGILCKTEGAIFLFIPKSKPSAP